MTRERRLVFGEVADLYDRSRPTYPAALFEGVFAYAGLSDRTQPARLCEIGAGTGKATVVVAPTAVDMGWSLTCVEPDPSMAEVLERNLAPIAGLDYSIEVTGFEDFSEARRAEGAYELLYAAQSFHWMAPERRLADAARVLQPGGTLALIWNVARPHPRPLKDAIAAAYAEAVPASERPNSPQPCGCGLPGAQRGEAVRELEASEFFGPPARESVYWVTRHSTAEWLDLLKTHSDHRLLPPDVLERLLVGVGQAVDANGGEVVVEYDAVAVLARSASQP